MTEIEEFVRRTCGNAGVPELLEDPAACEQIAALLRRDAELDALNSAQFGTIATADHRLDHKRTA